MVRIRLSFGSEKPHSLCAQMRYSALLSSSLGTQRFAALGAAAGKHCTTILGGHAGTEAMSAGAAHLARLICSFHLKFSCGQIDFSAIKGLCPIEICSMKWVLGISPPNKELFPYTPKTPSSRCRPYSSSAGTAFFFCLPHLKKTSMIARILTENICYAKEIEDLSHCWQKLTVQGLLDN